MGLKCVWIFILWPLGYNSHVLVKFGLLWCQLEGCGARVDFIVCSPLKMWIVVPLNRVLSLDKHIWSVLIEYLIISYGFITLLNGAPKKIHLSKRKGCFKSYLLNQKLYIHDCSDWQEFLLHGSPFHKFHRTIYLFTLYDT